MASTSQSIFSKETRGSTHSQFRDKLCPTVPPPHLLETPFEIYVNPKNETVIKTDDTSMECLPGDFSLANSKSILGYCGDAGVLFVEWEHPNNTGQFGLVACFRGQPQDTHFLSFCHKYGVKPTDALLSVHGHSTMDPCGKKWSDGSGGWRLCLGDTESDQVFMDDGILVVRFRDLVCMYSKESLHGSGDIGFCVFVKGQEPSPGSLQSLVKEGKEEREKQKVIHPTFSFHTPPAWRRGCKHVIVDLANLGLLAVGSRFLIVDGAIHDKNHGFAHTLSLPFPTNCIFGVDHDSLCVFAILEHVDGIVVFSPAHISMELMPLPTGVIGIDGMWKYHGYCRYELFFFVFFF